MKRLTICVALLALAGCASVPHVKITTQIKPIAVPIAYCPSPPIIKRPVLPIETITKSDTDGVVVQKYAATIAALIGYSQELERVIQQYSAIHAAYASKASKIAQQWQEKTGTKLIIPPTPMMQLAPPNK